MVTVLDLGDQPLANSFHSHESDSKKCPRHPLRLARCRSCHHTQLSHMVDRASLFSNYIYRSGTSRTLREYFAWLAAKITKETESGDAPRTVLELACNDGSQLDEFSILGWRTYGVDPAANLAAFCSAKHKVFVGLWGVTRITGLPDPGAITAIVAQNVMAHTTDPVAFLKACVMAMGLRTKLYIQTSQCRMHDTGQFDTIYHEHVSFFTAHSFHKAAELAGLTITNFEYTPIHGESCLLTMMRKPLFGFLSRSRLSVALKQELVSEKARGITDDWFYMRYRARAENSRDWVHTQLSSLSKQGYKIVAYGAAAKGMVLMHFLKRVSTEYDFEYVVDDEPMKQNTFCPGTSIPVVPSRTLNTLRTRVVVVIFAWNFFSEIRGRLLGHIPEELRKEHAVLAVVPFPTQRVVDLYTGVTLLENAFLPMQWPLVVPQRKVVLINHFFNEQFMLPYWIQHHAPHFDKAVLIDYNSTDNSADIVRRLAPSSWRIVRSRNKYFEAIPCDDEVVSYEAEDPSDWKLALTTAEFLIHKNLRKAANEVYIRAPAQVVRFPGMYMTGDDSKVLTRFSGLPLQRSQYILMPYKASLYGRYLHRHNERIYTGGRHWVKVPWLWATDGITLKFKWAGVGSSGAVREEGVTARDPHSWGWVGTL